MSEQNDKVPGLLRCGKCGLTLSKVNLYVNSGTVGAGNNKTEPCPNGCGNLWQVSWKQWAEEHAALSERFFIALQEIKHAKTHTETPEQFANRLQNLATRALEALDGRQ